MEVVIELLFPCFHVNAEKLLEELLELKEELLDEELEELKLEDEELNELDEELIEEDDEEEELFDEDEDEDEELFDELELDEEVPMRYRGILHPYLSNSQHRCSGFQPLSHDLMAIRPSRDMNSPVLRSSSRSRKNFTLRPFLVTVGPCVFFSEIGWPHPAKLFCYRLDRTKN
jgi:hypothetical protein